MYYQIGQFVIFLPWNGRIAPSLGIIRLRWGREVFVTGVGPYNKGGRWFFLDQLLPI